MQKKISRWVCGTVVASTLALSSCAMHKPDGSVNEDPFEGYNRTMFAFNTDVDHLLIRPAAKVYSTVTPNVLQEGIHNVFDNVDELSTLPNDFLQGNFRYMPLDVWRFVINTTLGIGGLFDVATRLGIQPHVESFGLTLAKWRGGQSAPYFVIPIFGPSTLQSGVGTLVDYYMTFWPYLKDQNINYIAQSVRVVDIRSRLLPSDPLVKNSFDPYVFVRDAYLQNQTKKIEDNQNLNKIPQKVEKVTETHATNTAKE